MNNIYEIPVVWQMKGTVKVSGISLLEAMNNFNKNISTYPLPNNGEYVEDSFGLITEDSHEMEEYVSLNKKNVNDLFYPEEQEVYNYLVKEMEEKTPINYTLFKHLVGREVMTIIDEFNNEYSFLSNFFTSPITYGGITYQSVESAFQAQKTKTFQERVQFKDLKPNEAKRLGRKVELREDWEDIKYQIMYELCWLKFWDNKELGLLLDATYPKMLVEGNHWHDNIWGRCTCPKCKDKASYNMLGKILMRIRMERRLMLNKKYCKIVIEKLLDEEEPTMTHSLDSVSSIRLESNFENVRYVASGFCIIDNKNKKPIVSDFGGVSHCEMIKFVNMYFNI